MYGTQYIFKVHPHCSLRRFFTLFVAEWNTIMCGWTTFCSPIAPLMGAWASVLWPLCFALPQKCVCASLFAYLFSAVLCRCQGQELLLTWSLTRPTFLLNSYLDTSAHLFNLSTNQLISSGDLQLGDPWHASSPNPPRAPQTTRAQDFYSVNHDTLWLKYILLEARQQPFQNAME